MLGGTGMVPVVVGLHESAVETKVGPYCVARGQKVRHPPEPFMTLMGVLCYVWNQLFPAFVMTVVCVAIAIRLSGSSIIACR